MCGLALGWALAPRYQPDPIRHQMVDRNRLGRYWPAVVLAVALLLGGVALATLVHNDSPRSHLLRGQDTVEREAWDEAVTEILLPSTIRREG